MVFPEILCEKVFPVILPREKYVLQILMKCYENEKETAY